MADRYQHTQFGMFIIIALGLGIGVVAGVSAAAGGSLEMAVVGLILAVAGVLFYQLEVQVSDAALRLRFGVGLIRRRFAIADVRAARAVRNTWFHGWGIHRLPRGWIYNVSGREAVEIELADGSVHRIGTDEPKALIAAIERTRGVSR
jgi:hypothetical protein